MTRYIPMHERTRPYWIKRGITLDGWVVWDRRRCIGEDAPGDILRPAGPIPAWAYPTHAAAIAALDAHLREQAATEPSA